MKTKTIITEITKDELVNLFSTATYGSEYFACRIPNGNYKGTELEDDNDYIEDKWAKVLLAGKTLYVYDYYSEEEAYGNLPHKWIEDKQAMRYTITFEDIKKGIANALDGEESYIKRCINNWMTDDSVNLDLTDAENIMQYIVFGELIYG